MGRRQSRGKRVIFAAGLLAGALITHDLLSPPQRDFGARAALFAIDRYRATVSPRLRRVVTCRFEPTCSLYSRESIRKHGLLGGGWRTAKRLARCGPWTKPGTVDRP